ncbi:MAG: baseplate J/gp47 family protein [Chitinivibrionales bacterium]|nr:baseplate J/gp47 family protein [Chitinivibrionales bacterium]
MSLPAINLDDRSFSQLVDSALQTIRRECPQWTDLSHNDPGRILLEAFAFMTETLLYRVNRIPQKAYVEFLRLLGVVLYPPTAAGVEVEFSVSSPLKKQVEIPPNTRIATAKVDADGNFPTFITIDSATMEKNQTLIKVWAYHCEPVDGERAGVGTGQPGLQVQAQKPPIVANLPCIVGVELSDDEVDEVVSPKRFNGKYYRIWSEVSTFAHIQTDPYVYMLDRVSGTIMFAPFVQRRTDDSVESTKRALAAIVGQGREIRLWYKRGGGLAGNVAPQTLAVLKDPVAGVSMQVTNPQSAAGGRAAESFENALLRGPIEFHSIQRAVTARDFELIALASCGGITRGQACTYAHIWKHATAGTVNIIIVPQVPKELWESGRIDQQQLTQFSTDEVKRQVVDAIDAKKPLGTSCIVSWAHYKSVSINGRVIVKKETNAEDIQQRIVQRLNHTINPIPNDFSEKGWPFGQPLRICQVYDVLLNEPEVLYADKVKFAIDEAPDSLISAVTSDCFQRDMWYAASGNRLLRSFNNGDGWELVTKFNDTEEINCIKAHPQQAGFVVVGVKGDNGSRLFISYDCFESIHEIPRFDFEVEDVCCSLRSSTVLLFLATDKGLYELLCTENPSPLQIVVDPVLDAKGYYSVGDVIDLLGTHFVAVAAQNKKGVYLSSKAGATNTYSFIGLRDKDVRKIIVDQRGARVFLWACITVGGNEAGEGAYRVELRGTEIAANEWEAFSRGWKGGSCNGVIFDDGKVLAASHNAGVLVNRNGVSSDYWEASAIGCGLPTRDVEKIFQPVKVVGNTKEPYVVIVGGPVGLFRSSDGIAYESICKKDYLETVPLPPNWLFCSGTHLIEVEKEDETR